VWLGRVSDGGQELRFGRRAWWGVRGEGFLGRGVGGFVALRGYVGGVWFVVGWFGPIVCGVDGLGCGDGGWFCCCLCV